jgi:hypothetical protein
MQITGSLLADRLKQLVDEQCTHYPAVPPRKRRWNPPRLPQIAVIPRVDFSCKPGVHRFAMSCLELRTWVPLSLRHIIISMSTCQSSKKLVKRTVVYPTRPVLGALRGWMRETERRPRGHPPGLDYADARATAMRRSPRVHAFFGWPNVSDTISRWVIRNTSSIVVMPRIALMIPSSKSVRIPCFRAILRMFCVDSPLNAISRT